MTTTRLGGCWARAGGGCGGAGRSRDAVDAGDRMALRQVLAPAFAHLGAPAALLDHIVSEAGLHRRAARVRLRETTARPEAIHLLVAGLARLECDAPGRGWGGLIVDLAGPGEPLYVPRESHAGGGPLLFHRTHTAVLMAGIDRGVLERVVGGLSPAYLVRLLGACHGGALEQLAAKAVLLRLTVVARVAVTIRSLARRFGAPVAGGERVGVRLTHTDWAALVGCERANATRALAHLTEAGAIRQERQHVIITDARRLDAEAPGGLVGSTSCPPTPEPLCGRRAAP